MFYNFKKGELVPCWIERGENIKEIRFGVDVLVYDNGESIQVYPYENSYEYIMKVKPIDNSQKVHVIGAPTEIYNDISVFFTNVEDKTK